MFSPRDQLKTNRTLRSTPFLDQNDSVSSMIYSKRCAWCDADEKECCNFDIRGNYVINIMQKRNYRYASNYVLNRLGSFAFFNFYALEWALIRGYHSFDFISYSLV